MAWDVVTTQIGSYACAEPIVQYPWVRQGVTLRESLSESFNQSFSFGDDWLAVRCNRRIACSLFEFDIDDLVMPAQTHGVNVVRVETAHRGCGALDPHNAVPDADALVTDVPGLLLGITVADCLPVFFLDRERRAVGVAHSGWRGTAGRIVIRTLETMRAAYGVESADCLVAIGPGIGPEDYEVDAVVHEAFQPEDAAASGVLTPTRPGHWSLDLTACVVHQLCAFGVTRDHICVSPWRTNRDPDLFFSHRMTPHCPRMGAFIGLRLQPMI